MARERRVHTDYDDGLECEELEAVAWVAGLAAVVAWVWLWLDVQADGIGPALGVFLQAVGTLSAVASGVAAVLAGVKGIEHRMTYRMNHRD